MAAIGGISNNGESGGNMSAYLGGGSLAK